MKMLLLLIRGEGEYPVLMILSLLKWDRKSLISSLLAGNLLLLRVKKEKLVWPQFSPPKRSKLRKMTSS
jgi:hypothetical protein